MSKDTILFFSFVAVVTLMLLFLPHVYAFETKAKQLIIVDHETGDILEQKDAFTPMNPSSMSKLMTLYVLFDHIQQGKLSADSTLKVSEKAWRKGGSKMFVRVNTEVGVMDLIRGIIVQSGNDACIVVAEGIAGSEEKFAELMNQKAQQIGLKHSHFVNATGWPDEQHLMSAYDLAILTQRLLSDFPNFYPLFAEEEFEYSNIKQPNRNRLLGEQIGVDGLKTGHTEAGGYGIVLSAKNDQNRRVIAVVNGLNSENARLDAGKEALLHGLNQFKTVQILSQEKILADIPVHYGTQMSVKAVASQSVRMTIPTEPSKALDISLKYQSPVQAPITVGAELGTITITHPSGAKRHIPLIAQEAVEEKGFFGRAIYNFLQWAIPAS